MSCMRTDFQVRCKVIDSLVTICFTVSGLVIVAKSSRDFEVDGM